MTAQLIIKGQDWRIVLNTGIDLSLATVTKILYKKPSGKKGSFDGTVSGKSIFYDITHTENNEDGVWQFQSYIEEPTDIQYLGNIVTQKIELNIK